MKTRMELAKEFILEMESVLDNMTPLDIEKAKDRVFFKALLKKLDKTKANQKRANKEGVIMTRYLFEVSEQTDVVNAELTRKGRGGDKAAISQWTKLAGLVLLFNKEDGVYGKPIKWTVTAPE